MYTVRIDCKIFVSTQKQTHMFMVLATPRRPRNPPHSDKTHLQNHINYRGFTIKKLYHVALAWLEVLLGSNHAWG